MEIKHPKKIVISRTDSIGDVVLTLPLIGILREKYPAAKLIFLGDTYTSPVIKCNSEIDAVWIWSDLKNLPFVEKVNWLKNQKIDAFIHVFPRKEIAKWVKAAKIKHRVGTSHRLFHFLTCNHRINFTRKNSELHESQLNTKLLKPFGIKSTPNIKQLTGYSHFTKIETLDSKFLSLIDQNKINLILHSKSKGSALEWGVDNFIKLSKALNPNQFNVFFTGTEAESDYFRKKIPTQKNIYDLSGKMSLEQLIAFISKADGLIAASTGPLHIAGLSGIKTIGLFTPKKPLHQGRWKPLGNKVFIIEEKEISERNQPLNINLRLVLQKAENLFL